MSKKELKRLALGFRKGFLKRRESDRMCFSICYPLSGYLKFLGVETQLEEVYFPRTSHYFLRLPDGDILDPTADQFSGPWCKLPKVYIGPMPEIYQKWIEEDKQSYKEKQCD